MRGRAASRRRRVMTRGQRGQAMLEYALISLTVAAGFAVAAQLGASDAFIKLISAGSDPKTGKGSVSASYNILLPQSFTPADIHDNAAKFNEQIQLQ
ncbi:MAG: hypothetical protein M3O87_06565 [Candidatus Dormibacteraeota bacterium]|nr:hypothetical protein [Candidatus Dormibacteraeota bacterium]